ncbi:MAG: hypothetical protein JXR23_10115 [Pontiellaceae bacterium]|nr:hypothetical protein [Pontiellaceae bacterium]
MKKERYIRAADVLNQMSFLVRYTNFARVGIVATKWSCAIFVGLLLFVEMHKVVGGKVEENWWAFLLLVAYFSWGFIHLHRYKRYMHCSFAVSTDAIRVINDGLIRETITWETVSHVWSSNFFDMTRIKYVNGCLYLYGWIQWHDPVSHAIKGQYLKHKMAIGIGLPIAEEPSLITVRTDRVYGDSAVTDGELSEKD